MSVQGASPALRASKLLWGERASLSLRIPEIIIVNPRNSTKKHTNRRKPAVRTNPDKICSQPYSGGLRRDRLAPTIASPGDDGSGSSFIGVRLVASERCPSLF